MRFEDLQISEPLLCALRDKKYNQPTPIQKKAIPLILKRNDILGSAQTGTGKTAAFTVPIIQLIQQKDCIKPGKPKLRALILTPTRELANQIDGEIKQYRKYTKVKHAVIYGGISQSRQVHHLKKGIHILVATPGRLLDLINQGHVSLQTIKIFVLDEVDRMLDMGFIMDIKKLIKLLPEKKQSLFFSATIPENIIKLSKQILKNPEKIQISPVSSAADTVRHYLYYTNRSSKKALLLHILQDTNIDQVLIFTRTKRGADHIGRTLKRNRIRSAVLHGDKAQNLRQKILRQFKTEDLKVLVATDIASRGIDITSLKYVINYDIPNVPETYVHRIGRSGRAGEEGTAISISEPEENIFVRNIERLMGKRIEQINDHPYPQSEKPMTSRQKKEWNKKKQFRTQEYFAKKSTSKVR